ncbi:MAG: Trk system potassium transporter TrkA [Holosporales bacterium]|jgi:trk system potassium uptake protein TrkA|nr:Trk system potassium transporter TrkA [Holosporales bacterium]
MKAIVLGAGRVGYGIAKELSLNENDVSIIDSSPEVLKIVANKIDVRPVLGHASDIDVLIEAGISDTDVLIAVTSSDEVNITSCQIADFMFGIETKIARINKKSYFRNGDIFSHGKFPVDVVVSPEIEISDIVKRSISIPGAIDVLTCMGNAIKIIGIVCRGTAPIVNVPLKFLTSVTDDLEIAIVGIRRGRGNIIIPNRDDCILADDEVYLACRAGDAANVIKLFGYGGGETSKIVMIGGGDMCDGIVDAILSQKEFNLSIKIIEQDIKRAEFLSEKLDEIEIIPGSPLDVEILNSANISEAGIVISMTDDDKTNILACLLAKRLGATRVSAVLSESYYSDLPYSLGIDSLLDSRHAIIAKILHYLGKGGIEDILKFDDGEVEVFAIEVYKNSYAVGVITDNIVSKNEGYVAIIIRNDKIIMRPKRFLVDAGDKMLLVAKQDSIKGILKLFQGKPKYLA